MLLWRGRDVLLVALLTTGALWEAVVAPLSPPGYLGHASVNLLGSVLAVAPVLVRRRRPLLLAAGVTAGTTLLWTQARGDGELPFVGYATCLLVGYTLGAHLGRAEAVAAGAVTFAAWGLTDLVDARAGLPSVHQDLGFYVLVALALAAGAGVRALRERSDALRAALEALAAERAAREAAAVEQERHRIARDMHDVLTHTVSAIAVQAGALRVSLGEAPQADAARALEDAAREAMHELRHLLGVLHEQSAELAPSPGLADVDRLCVPLQAAGVSVEVVREGPLDGVRPGQALAVFRLVQESVTNVLKHGVGVGRVRICLSREPTALRVCVDDDGAVPPHWRPGRGVTGMTERVEAYGGRLTAGPSPSGRGWQVLGELPL